MLEGCERKHPIGTIFKVDVAISQKEGGGIYAHAKSKTVLLTTREWDTKRDRRSPLRAYIF